MAKQAKADKQAKRAAAKAKRRTRNSLFALLTGLVLLGVSAAGLAAYKHNWKQERDLSVLGNGTPSVVQVHDTGCPLCRKLMSNTESALRGIDDDELQYRIADINTTRGRGFANKHHVRHVTLLLFDGDGDLQRTIEGVTSAETLKDVFTSFVEKER